MPRPDVEFPVNTVVSVNGKPALVVKADEYSIAVKYVDENGYLAAGGCTIRSYDKDIKVERIDFAQVRTVVQLPPGWQGNIGAKPPPDYNVESHQSFGVATIVKTNGHADLFMSPFKHHNFLSLTIKRAERIRNGNEDHAFGTKEIVEVLFSEAQWARFISSIGMGDGVPCTISSVAGSLMPYCPHKNEKTTFETELKDSTEQALTSLNDAINLVNSLLDKNTVTKAERKTILEKLRSAEGQLIGTMPFILDMFNERMSNIVDDAKIEVDAFVNRALSKVGLDKLASGPMTLLPEPKDVNHE